MFLFKTPQVWIQNFPMKYILTFVVLLSATVNAHADYFDFMEFRGWTPRYMYVDGDNLIGHHHYFGMAFYTPQGKGWEGLSARYGKGTDGNKINVSYSAGSSFFGVDIGFSYAWIDEMPRMKYSQDIHGLGVELGLRMWFANIVAFHAEQTSYISMGYGF